jgi:threonine/homoserine/homoserine lactone efflux protein
MTVGSTVAFIAAVFVLGITPGPAVFATIARALASGLWPAFAFNVGVVVGDLVLMLLAVFGLAAVAQALGEWFVVVKIAGGLYLVWLGWKLWASEPGELRPEPLVAARQFRRNMIGGFVLTLGNPKAIIFYAAFLPTFVDLTRIGLPDIAVLAAVITAVLMTTNMAYGVLAARARIFFKSRRAMRNLDRGAGTLMIGAGVAVATR